MRTFSFLILLLGTLFIGNNALAQSGATRVWYDQTQFFGPQIEGSYFEAFGVGGGYPEFQGTIFDSSKVQIDNYYAAGGMASHRVDKLTIDRFWATSDTMGDVKEYTSQYSSDEYGGVAIENFILQVGAQNIEFDKTRNFGNPGEKLLHVTLTDTSVSNGIHQQTKGPVPNNPTLWGISGDFGVENYGTIVTADVSGGTFANTSTGVVENLNYSGGTYEDKGGKIQTLTLAGKSEKQSWGNVDTLMFDSNRNGLITLTGFVDEGNKLGFSGINVQEQVNFANGEVVLDMTEVVEGLLEKSASSTYRRNADWTTDWATLLRSTYGREAFTAASIFGDIDFENKDASTIAVQWWSEFAPQPDTVYIVSAGVWQKGWQTESAPTPEPATLAVFGLGLAGLGLASRRRKE